MDRLEDVISYVVDILAYLKELRSIWETGHDCHTCTKTCDHKLSRYVTWNCPLWEGEE